MHSPIMIPALEPFDGVLLYSESAARAASDVIVAILIH